MANNTPTGGVDLRSFQDTLRKYIAVTSKTIPDALNTKMLYIAQGALKNTPKASRSDIESSLSITGYAQQVYKRGPKKGQMNQRGKLSRVITSSPIIYKIINARRSRNGQKGLYGAEMKIAVKRFLAKRFRSIGTLKAGWVSAIKRLSGTVGGFGQFTGSLPPVKGRSQVRLAKQGISPSVELEYAVNSFDASHRQYLDPRVVQALSDSFRKEEKSTNDYLIGKLQSAIDNVR